MKSVVMIDNAYVTWTALHGLPLPSHGMSTVSRLSSTHTVVGDECGPPFHLPNYGS